LELDHDAGNPIDKINLGYTSLLSKRGGATWEFQADPKVRYAFLIHEVVDRIYLGGDYFGLEMFALTLGGHPKPAIGGHLKSGQRNS